MSLRLKLILFISFLFISAIGNAVLTFQLDKYSEDKLEWVNHTHEVIMHTEHFLSHIQDTESGQRGFLLTEDPYYLKPYYSGLIESKEHFALLRNLTSDNPQQQKRLDLIKKSVQLKFDELAKTIELTQKNNNHNTEALKIVKQNKGQQYMNDIKGHIKEFINEEMLLLEQRKGDFKAHRASITTLIILEIIFFIFLAFMTVTFLNKNLFHPLRLLLSSTHKMEKGKKLDLIDVISDDEMGYLLSSFYKMNEKVHTRTENLDYKAHHDELTGLKNRTSMHLEIEDDIKHLKDFKTKFAVLFLDLNKFKELNDTLGHDAGDAMLIETASRLKDSVRCEDIVFRLGGDEFLVLLKNIKNSLEVENVLSHILEAIKTPVMIQGKPIDISISIGVAISPDDTQSSDEILKYSDIAMYEAKKDKSIAYKFFDKSMLKRSNDS